MGLIPEFRARVQDLMALEAKLIVLGAAFLGEGELTDTYFTQKDNRVIKVSESTKGNHITRLHKSDDGFSIESKEHIHNPSEIKERLAEEHGMRKIIKRMRKTFAYRNSVLHLDDIPEKGKFVVIEGLTAKLVLQELKIKDDQLIRTSFSEL